MKKENKKRYMFKGNNNGNLTTISFNRNKSITLMFGNVVWLEYNEYTAYSDLFEPLPEIAEPEITEPEIAEPEITEPEIAEPEIAEELIKKYTKSELVRMKINELEDICVDLEIKSGGKKKDLIERILENIG